MSGKGADKKGGAKNNQADQARDEKMAQIAAYRRQCDAHERLIHVASESLQRAQLEVLNYKKRLVELNHKFTKEEAGTSSMTHDMFRVYTEMQSKMEERKRAHQQAIKELREKLAELRLSLERTKQQKDSICAEKTRLINEQKQKMEEMAIGFGVELKETLDRMSRNIKDGDRAGGAAHGP